MRPQLQQNPVSFDRMANVGAQSEFIWMPMPTENQAPPLVSALDSFAILSSVWILASWT